MIRQGVVVGKNNESMIRQGVVVGRTENQKPTTNFTNNKRVTNS